MGSSFTVTSFNARWAMTPEDVPYDLAAVVTGFDTDLIALQEVWIPTDDPDRLRATAEKLGYRMFDVALSPSFVDPRPEIVEDPARADGTWGIVLLSRLPVPATRTVDLGRMVERLDVARRLAILATVVVDQTPVTVAAHHLSFFAPNALAQLQRLGGYLPGGMPSVVVGDCNLWGPLASGALGGHRRAVRGRTWPARRPHSQLDHVLVSPEIEVLAADVGPPTGSDHLPIAATLRVCD